MPRQTGLIVVVPEAQEHVLITHVPAHVTILFPFVDGEDVDEAALRELFARFRPFDFVLDRLERFADGQVVWLHPEPSEPFVELTQAVWERWPSHPPYEGVHDVVIPHLTISEEPAEVDVPLPIAARATEVTLIEQAEPGGPWATRLVLPLGSSAARPF